MLKYEFVSGCVGNVNTPFTDDEKNTACIVVTTIEHLYLSLGISLPNERFVIKKFPKGSMLPRFCLARNNPPALANFICISMDKLSYWCQAIFQLGHEMTHAAIHYNSPPNTDSTSWIEETICEAMALFFLNVFFINWDKIELSKINPKYALHIKSYLEDELSKVGSEKLSLCRNYDELKQIDADSQTYREQRENEMHELYKLLNADNVRGLLLYRWYLQSDPLLLNTAKYRKAFPHNAAVSYLCDLQDSIFSKETSEAD